MSETERRTQQPARPYDHCPLGAATGIAVWLVLVGWGSASAQPAPKVEAVPEMRPGLLAGYLGTALPDSSVLVPPPPSDGAALQHDHEGNRASQKLRDTPRYELATSDADLAFPRAAGIFACALDAPISEQATPRLYQLLRRVLTDAALATYRAKDKYQRDRPFEHYDEGTCTPASEERLRADGSYPSGHASIGWAWALVLTELAPDRSDELLARGRSVGESRLVCNVHWPSDVLEGRHVGAATVAQLHSNPTFRSDMDAAKSEIEELRDKGEKPAGDCAAESAALVIKIPGVR